MVDDIFYVSSSRNNKAWLNEKFVNWCVDTDNIIKLKEVNKMKDWITVHNNMEGDVAIIRKDSITYVGIDDETGGTVIHTNNFIYVVRESYTTIVRRILE